MHFISPRQTNRGQAMIIAVLFFLFITVTIVGGVAFAVLRQVKMGQDIIRSKESYYLAEAGIEDAVYRLKSGKTIGSSVTLTLNGNSATVDVATTASGKSVSSRASAYDDTRKIKTNISLGEGIAFHYGVQAGQGGFNLANTSSVTGNIHSSGPVVGSNNYVYGDVISSGATGLVQGIHATGTVYAHTISNSTIDKDAYYTSISGSTVTGSSYPNSPDQSGADLPISDDQISDWETQAVAGGVISSPCPYQINSSMSLGPIKITCDVVISGNSTVLSLTGPVWVTGNITTQNSPSIVESPSLGSANVAFIADNPSNKTTSSQVILSGHPTFSGSGSVGSYVFLISQNNSAETGGSNDAVTVTQGTGALVVYAGHGRISLANSINVKEVTAYKINLSNSATVSYDTGLPSVLFSSGPSGGYNIQSWGEVQ